MSTIPPESKAPPIGPLIQRERKERRLTLEQLAALSGVSKSMLSQIERGQANPTFAVLWSLTRALKIGIADLLDGNAVPSARTLIEVVTTAHTPKITSPDGLCRLRILSPPRLAGRMEWYELEIAPSGVLDSAAHAPGTSENFTASSPGLEVTSGDATQALLVGETARYPADVAHCITNMSSSVATGLLVVIYG